MFYCNEKKSKEILFPQREILVHGNHLIVKQNIEIYQTIPTIEKLSEYHNLPMVSGKKTSFLVLFFCKPNNVLGTEYIFSRHILLKEMMSDGNYHLGNQTCLAFRTDNI